MMTAPRGKNTTKEDPAPPKGNHTQPAADTAPPADRHSPSERITVSLIPQAGEGLVRLQAQTALSKTDLVNRAISLYEFIEAQRSAGHEILIRDKTTGETQIIVLV